MQYHQFQKIMEEEFQFSVLPSNVAQFAVPDSFLIGFYADVTLLTIPDRSDEDSECDYEHDFEYLDQERFVYKQDLLITREDLLNETKSRPTLIRVLTKIDVPEHHHDDIVNGILSFVKTEENSCKVIAVNIEHVRYAGYDMDEDHDGAEQGMEVEKVEPTFVNVEVDQEMSLENDCRICFNKFQIGTRVRKMNCGHVFHRTCLLHWFDKVSTCPLCRNVPPNFFSAPEEIL